MCNLQLFSSLRIEIEQKHPGHKYRYKKKMKRQLSYAKDELDC